MRPIRVFLCALALAAGLALVPAAASFAQSPSPSATASPSVYQKANWSKYLAFAIAGIGVAVLGMAALGFLIQGPGFRKIEEEETE